MAITDYKSQAMARELYQELKSRLATLASPVTVTLSEDNSSAPLILLGTPSVAGSQGGTIRIKPIEWPNVQTSVGLSQPVYGPHDTEFVYENIAGNTVPFLLAVQLTCGKRGTNFKVYRTASSTAPTYTQMIAANLQATYQPDAAFGFIGSM